MKVFMPSDGKINLTLRIVGRRENGYHDLISLFMKIPSLESLTVTSLEEHNVGDTVEVKNFPIDGTNLVERVIELLRDEGVSIPSVSVSIEKQIPPGTGLGCGSGNGVALYRWASSFFDDVPHKDILASVGADLPFLAQSASLALVEGIGDEMSFLPALDLCCVLIIPFWRSNTVLAYESLDDFFSGAWVKKPDDARSEALNIVDRLSVGQKVGMLPNDFLMPLMKSYPEYGVIFEVIARSGALAWGLSGSGSAVFALYRRGDLSRGRLGALCTLESIEKITVVE